MFYSYLFLVIYAVLGNEELGDNNVFCRARKTNRLGPTSTLVIVSMITRQMVDTVRMQAVCKLVLMLREGVKQARKSSEDTHFTGYARFEKVWAR